MLADIAVMRPVDDAHAAPEAALVHIQAQQPDYISFSDWLILDQIEKEKGQATGRPRVKFSKVSDMLSVIASLRLK